MSDTYDVLVLGGGQASLAADYYLRRAGLDFVILDGQPHPGPGLSARLAIAAPVLPGRAQSAALYRCRVG